MREPEYQQSNKEGGLEFGGPDLFEEPTTAEPELFGGAAESQSQDSEDSRKPSSESETAQAGGPTPSPFGVNLFGDPLDPGRSKGKLGDLFLLPPFTVLDTRQGYWQDR